MSHSVTLYCEETMQMVHVAEHSSSWFRGADSATVVGAFCLAHAGKDLRATLQQPGEFQNCMEWVAWTPENCKDSYFAVTGRDLAKLELE